MCRHVVILAVELTTFTHLFTARSGFSPGGNQPWKTSHRRLKTVSLHLHPQRMKSIAQTGRRLTRRKICRTDVEEVAFRRRVNRVGSPSTSKPLESTSAGRPKRRIMRKRTLFEKYCCEVSTFTVLTVLSLAYYTARYYRESKSLNPEASLSEKQRIRYWDWPDPSTHKQIGHNWNHAITTMWLPDDDEVAFQLGTGSEHDLSPEGPGHVKMPEFFFSTHDIWTVCPQPRMMHCESTLKLTMNWPTRNCVLI